MVFTASCSIGENGEFGEEMEEMCMNYGDFRRVDQTWRSDDHVGTKSDKRDRLKHKKNSAPFGCRIFMNSI